MSGAGYRGVPAGRGAVAIALALVLTGCAGTKPGAVDQWTVDAVAEIESLKTSGCLNIISNPALLRGLINEAIERGNRRSLHVVLEKTEAHLDRVVPDLQCHLAGFRADVASLWLLRLGEEDQALASIRRAETDLAACSEGGPCYESPSILGRLDVARAGHTIYAELSRRTRDRDLAADFDARVRHYAAEKKKLRDLLDEMGGRETLKMR